VCESCLEEFVPGAGRGTSPRFVEQPAPRAPRPAADAPAASTSGRVTGEVPKRQRDDPEDDYDHDHPQRDADEPRYSRRPPRSAGATAVLIFFGLVLASAFLGGVVWLYMRADEAKKKPAPGVRGALVELPAAAPATVP
jgi:hypothetical protein